MLINLEILQQIVKMTNKLPNPRDLVLNKDTTVSNGIKGHQHRKKNELNKKYFEIQDLEEFD
jgi:hypothetical protein